MIGVTVIDINGNRGRSHMTRMTKTILAAAFGLGLAASAALAGPEGTYKVEGKAPDGSSYSGTAVVSASGQTFKVVWTLGKEKYIGTAVGNDDFFAVTYDAGGSAHGLAVYGRKDDGWMGVWTMSGDTKVGAEKLTRK